MKKMEACKSELIKYRKMAKEFEDAQARKM
jgi:hypothetical protein